MNQFKSGDIVRIESINKMATVLEVFETSAKLKIEKGLMGGINHEPEEIVLTELINLTKLLPIVEDE